MPLEQGDALAGGWVLERVSDDSLRFSRARSVELRRALSRLIVMGGCLAVTLALVGVTAKDPDDLWLITSSLIVLFGATALVALVAALRDLWLARLGVALEFDRAGRCVRGVEEGEGLLGQFRVRAVELPRDGVTVAFVAFDERHDGSGMIKIKSKRGWLLAPDLPSLEDGRALLARAG